MNEPLAFWEELLREGAWDALDVGSILTKVLSEPSSLVNLEKQSLHKAAAFAEALHRCITAEMHRRGDRLEFGETVAPEAALLHSLASLKDLVLAGFAPNDIATTRAFSDVEEEIRKLSVKHIRPTV